MDSPRLSPTSTRPGSPQARPAGQASQNSAHAARASTAPTAQRQEDFRGAQRDEKSAYSGTHAQASPCLRAVDPPPDAGSVPDHPDARITLSNRFGANMQHSLGETPTQECELLCAGLAALNTELPKAWEARAKRARASARAAAATERAALRHCETQFKALAATLKTALPQHARGLCKYIPSTAAQASLRAAVAPALAALMPLSELRRAQVIGESYLYPERPIGASELAVLARLTRDRGGSAGATADDYLERCKRIALTARAQQVRGLPMAHVMQEGWGALLRAGRDFRQTPLTQAVEETLVAQQRVEVQQMIDATLHEDAAAWHALTCRLRALSNRFHSGDDVAAQQYGGERPEDFRQLSDTLRAHLPEVTAFSRSVKKRIKFLELCQMARFLEASESQMASTLATYVHLPSDALYTLSLVRQILQSIDEPTHKKHADYLSKLQARLLEQGVFVEALHIDSVADDALLTFLRVAVSKMRLIGQCCDEAKTLLRDAVRLHATLSIAAARRDATRDGSVAPQPEVPVVETANEVPAIEATPRQPAAPPIDCTFTQAAAGFETCVPEQPTASKVHWRHVLRAFDASERALATAHFNKASFANEVEAAAYHFAKHREPGQSFAAYVACAKRATQEFVGLLVPSLRDPSIRLCAVDDEANYCVFSRSTEVRIVTYRNRAALGR